jgi:transcriptional regulator with XRE-family HTH domain
VFVLVNLDNLYQRIINKGIKAKKVSDDTGISTGNISDWKSGRSMPSAPKLDILADYLDCSVDYLLGRTDNPEVNR